MENQHNPAARFKVYQQINDKIIAQLQNGNIFWRKPWNARLGLPMNLVTRKRYHGFNLFYLQAIVALEKFSCPWFVTFKQATFLGGRIRKGSHGFDVVKWVEAKKQEVSPSDSLLSNEDKKRFFPVAYRVFNGDQTEGLELPSVAPALPSIDKIAACEDLLSQMPLLPKVIHEGDQPVYRRLSDSIHLPEINRFNPREEYYSTLFHEIIHSTGHPQRLNREELVENDGFGGSNYSREELVAEFGAAYLCGIADIDPKTLINSAAYIKSWLQNIKDDPTIIFKASTKAQAAIDFLLPEQRVDPAIPDNQS